MHVTSTRLRLRCTILCAAVVAGVLSSCAAPPCTMLSHPGMAHSPVTTLSVVGTNDFHGQVARAAVLGGYLENLRRLRRLDGGGTLLVSGGDLFQGTLESNLVEGASVIRAYNALGYTAATIGNHEFDYGPVGPEVVPVTPGGDAPEDQRRGALFARVAEANFPFLVANIFDRESGQRVQWPGIRPYTIVQEAGVKVGIIGVATEETTRTTIAGNVDDLVVRGIAETLAELVPEIRSAGAEVVVVAAHAGARCEAFVDVEDLSSCEVDEIFDAASALPEGFVDVIVAGHTHRAVAHEVNGIAIIESYAYGTAFGRVDLSFDLQQRRVVDTRIFPPQVICDRDATTIEACPAARYEGRVVRLDQDVLAAVQEDLARAEALRERSLGVELSGSFTTSRSEEGPLGNLLADLMRRARPSADVAMLNGGGIRAPLPAGSLNYGSLYQTFPFDNRYARVRVSADELVAHLRENLEDDGSVFSISGVTIRARCVDGELVVTLLDDAGRPVEGTRQLLLVTSDFLATGSLGMMATARARGDVDIENGPPIRETLVETLAEMGGALSPSTYFSEESPRLSFPGTRPVHCSE